MNSPFSSLAAQTVFTVLGACLGTMFLVPKIISIVKYKHLMDNPNQRSSHCIATPSLGGVAFYIVFVISLYFNNKFDSFNIAMGLLPGLTILFFLGLKDDLVVIAPSTKLIGQVIACLFVIWDVKFQIVSFHGFLGIQEVNPVVGGIIALIIMLTIINAFNLIDGIDGLAASIGIVSFICFGSLFMYLERYFMAFCAYTMTGILSGFLTFNLSRQEKRRIFMGDTGSMLIGFLVAVMCIRFVSLSPEALTKLPFHPSEIPVFIYSALMIPIYDTTRVFIVRLKNKRSPFAPDRNHMHHLILDAFGMSHRRTTFAIAAYSSMVLVINYVFIRYTNLWATALLLVVGTIGLTLWLNALAKRIEKKKTKKFLVSKNLPALIHYSKDFPISNTLDKAV